MGLKNQPFLISNYFAICNFMCELLDTIGSSQFHAKHPHSKIWITNIPVQVIVVFKNIALVSELRLASLHGAFGSHFAAWRCPVFSLSGSWLLCSSGVAFGDAGSVAGKGPRWINMGTLPLRMDLYGFVMIYQILWRGHEVWLRIITCLFQPSQVPTEMPTSPMSDLGDDTAGGPQLWSLRRRCWPSGGQNGVSLLLTLV